MRRIVGVLFAGIGIDFLAAMLLACPTSCRAPVCACARDSRVMRLKPSYAGTANS
ncbi:MAG: hypothetical protein PWQ30_703 [Euryarchaeota archaeon]|jgi:hypothetical protein|nr:hypothetical protein [Euryarchaeota archaeon]